MKIAIIGTRGIPNRYGGFEQFAQHLSEELSTNHEITVFNPHYRKDTSNYWKSVKIEKALCPRILGPLGHIIYDYVSLKKALNSGNDVVLVCGYVSSYFALWRFKKYKNRILVHMDGFEWKRAKWWPIIRHIIKYIERNTVMLMPHLVTDHPFLEQYFMDTYQKKVHQIAYGCKLREVIINNNKHIDKPYFLVIARNEKENNIEMICRAFIAADIDAYLMIFTNKKFKVNSPKIKVWLNEYDDTILNFYRSKALAYVHAYTVGGTNPSLIESMAYCSTIIALKNDFHQYLLENNALYFNDENDLKEIMKKLIHNKKLHLHLESNRKKIESYFQWHQIAQQYLCLFNEMLNEEESK
ncbi:MAG: DUF1972 domain-containing protein [Bacteroidales bacterium]|nr:DUF1972 domain-containing protein [Bacteroidales bacterium]